MSTTPSKQQQLEAGAAASLCFAAGGALQSGVSSNIINNNNNNHEHLHNEKRPEKLSRDQLAAERESQGNGKQKLTTAVTTTTVSSISTTTDKSTCSGQGCGAGGAEDRKDFDEPQMPQNELTGSTDQREVSSSRARHEMGSGAAEDESSDGRDEAVVAPGRQRIDCDKDNHRERNQDQHRKSQLQAGDQVEQTRQAAANVDLDAAEADATDPEVQPLRGESDATSGAPKSPSSSGSAPERNCSRPAHTRNRLATVLNLKTTRGKLTPNSNCRNDSSTNNNNLQIITDNYQLRAVTNSNNTATQISSTNNKSNQPKVGVLAGSIKDEPSSSSSSSSPPLPPQPLLFQNERSVYYKPPTTKRLSYLQSLLLTKWPCLALTICIMCSLLFGILLSGLTVYLMHGVSDCSELASRLNAASLNAARPESLNHHRHHIYEDQPQLQQQQHHRHRHQQSANLLPSAPHEMDVFAASSASSLSESSASKGGANATNSKSATVAFQRLPAHVTPDHYEVFVWPYIAEPSFHFNGSVSIQLKCHAPTDSITLHAVDLEIDERSVRLQNVPDPVAGTNALRKRRQTSDLKPAPKVARLSQNKQLQYVVVHLDEPLVAGQAYQLQMDFVGHLNDDLVGFYKIKYERVNSNETTWIAATQFQATDARRAFPCFDEPLYKATFGIKIRHWKNMTALSNMPLVSSEESPDGLWITDTFAKSQRMSTYLVAFAVTNFESRTAGKITVWARPGFVHMAEYALDIADKILRHYEDFFGIAYPLPKMDMIALPDFNAGAMENWGLITYRETAMLFDENYSSAFNKQRVAVVVAHELAHQWFGNLVTPKWWDDLWLNEGFASYVEYIGVDHVEPKWRMLEQFVTTEVQDVLRTDSLSSSHQISVPVNNPDEISEIFDHISYAKGASIIRMMSHFLTERVFLVGLQRYLRALKYKNAEQNDLWSHLNEAQQLFRQDKNHSLSLLEPIDIGHVMNSWTLQTGYPLVTLTRDYDKNTAQLEQVRYQPLKLQQEQQKQQKWEVPITYTWKSDQNWQATTRIWMHQNQTGALSLKALPPTSDEWMILNVQQVGFYRVNYDLQNWKLLINQLQTDHTLISPTNRAQLLNDLFELAKSSFIDYELAMEATKYLKRERDYLSWETILSSFNYIDDMLQRTPIYGDWQDYFSQLLEPYYERYKDFDWTVAETGGNGSQSGNNNKTTLTASNGQKQIDSNDVIELFNENNAVLMACQLNNQHCIDKARRHFKIWRTTGVNKIKPNMRSTVYCTAIEFGDKSDWDFLWSVYEKVQVATERDRIHRALSCSRELWILARYLEWTFDKTKPIRRQDGAFVFRLVAKNNYGRDLAFDFVRERWSTVKEFYGKSSFSFGQLIKSLAPSRNTQIELDQLKAFYEAVKSDAGSSKRAFQIAIEEIEGNVQWRNKNYKILENWLTKERQKK